MLITSSLWREIRQMYIGHANQYWLITTGYGNYDIVKIRRGSKYNIQIIILRRGANLFEGYCDTC